MVWLASRETGELIIQPVGRQPDRLASRKTGWVNKLERRQMVWLARRKR